MTVSTFTPAFPHPALADEACAMPEGFEGMSMRDYFAAQALPAVFSDPSIAATYQALEENQLTQLTFVQFVAATSYRYADAMMQARIA